MRLEPSFEASRSTSFVRVTRGLFARAVAPDPVEAHLAITAHDVVADPTAYPSLDDVDAVLITGSKHNAFENDPWILALVEFTKKVLATDRIRTVGVCFGHQICARAMGLPVGRSDKGWEVSVTEVDLSEEGKEFFKIDGDTMVSIPCWPLFGELNG